MKIGKVIGNLWATKKDDSLKGMKLLVVAPYNVQTKEQGTPIVAGDTIGAGVGEMVIWIQGSMSRVAAPSNDIAVDAVIVGIVDGVDLE